MSTLFILGILVFEASMLVWMWMMFQEQKIISNKLEIIVDRCTDIIVEQERQKKGLHTVYGKDVYKNVKD